jgi:molecular chaperone GrpE
MTRRSRKDKDRAGQDAEQGVAAHPPLDPDIPPALDPEIPSVVQERAPEDAAAPVPAAGEAERAAELGEDIVREVEQLRTEREQLSREAAEARDKYLRTYADFENYRKRMQRDMADFRKYANDQLALDLLSVADHLQMAISHANEGGEANQALVQGVELVYKQLLGILEKYGIKPFKAIGEPFNPAMHDAMMQVESADLPENCVAQVFMEGYLYHDRVLRHAKVGVTKRPAPEAAPAPAEPDVPPQAGSSGQQHEEGPNRD